MAGSREPSDRELERLVLRLVGAVIAVVLAAAVAIVVTREESAGQGVGGVPSEEGEVNAIGPLARAEVEAYIAERGAALDELSGRRAAVVSFTRYLTEDEVGALLDANRFLVAGPGGDPAVVSGGLDDWVEAARAQAAEEVANLESLLESTNQSDFAATYREDIARYRHLAGALDSAAAIVFGAVVVASADELRALSGNEAVRLVDIGPSDEPPPDDAARGLRPEETVRTGDPPYRPTA